MIKMHARRFALINLLIAAIGLFVIPTASAAPALAQSSTTTSEGAAQLNPESEIALRTAFDVNGIEKADQEAILTLASQEPAELYVIKDDSMSTMAPNYCSFSPDRWFDADFKPACAAHDYCYSRFTPFDRLQCDQWFINNLGEACRKAYGAGSWHLRNCYVVALGYHEYVRKYASFAYQGTGANN